MAFPRRGREDDSMAEHTDTQRIHGYCGLCIARCGTVATVEDGRFTRLDPDPAHPTGQALCAKGRAAPEPPQQQTASSGGATVEVFMTSWCGYCKKMVRFLNEKGIPYTAYDIEKDTSAARTYRELGGNGVPVVRIGSHVVHGYSPDAVMSYLEGR